MEEQRELTVLFYFASDNPLAPLVIPEIKAIKDAGFQEHTSVLVYFDPMEKTAPSRLLDVNHLRKMKKKTFIGDGADPFVRHMSEDSVAPAELTGEMLAMLSSSGSFNAVESLKNFIQFAIEKRKAKNFMLFLIGHGMVVGNDAFLPDDDPVSAISLEQLRDLCGMFNEGDDSRLRLLGLHSCSMSSIEVAYELRGKADYMLATQGTAFVNGWPYRQLLKKTLNQVKRAKETAREEARLNNANEEEAVNSANVDYDELISKMYSLCVHNFTDFLTAGYSCDLVLCSLDPEGLERLTEPLPKLVSILKEELAPRVSLIKDLVLLAHWESQSFWSENYTDLWDFCDCLARRCDETVSGLEKTDANKVIIDRLTEVSRLCGAVKNILAPEAPAQRSEGIVLRADNSGSEFQFARGLSVYFPWSEPLDDHRATFKSQQEDIQQEQREAKSQRILESYSRYAFTTEFDPNSWFSFLNAYFRDTKREVRQGTREKLFDELTTTLLVKPEVAKEAFGRAENTFTIGVLKRTPELKKTPEVGADCTCPSIKNFPTDTDRKIKQFAITPEGLEAFISRDDEIEGPQNE